MVKCPICEKEFDTERGMKIHKARAHEEETDEEYVEELEEQEEKKYMEWRPEIAMVTVVGIIAILLLVAVTATSVNRLGTDIQNLKGNQTKTYTPTDIDHVLCGKAGVSRIIYCENATECVPQGNNEVKIISIQAPGEEASSKQRQIIKNITREIDNVEVKNICLSTKENLATCDDVTWGQDYEEWSQKDYYNIEGLPTLIMNCVYKRTGTYASSNLEKEKEELTEIIKALK